MKVVFDIDDTICKTINRDYYNSISDTQVIEKLNYLHDVLGFEIELYTSRGMVSCNGDMEKIISKNQAILVEWLKKNNVHYDKLTFGKPIADLYVDDKGISIDEFMVSQYYELSGGSGKKVYRVGGKVKKELGSEKDKFDFQLWEIENKGFCKTPKIYSYLYNSVYMEYIEGHILKDGIGFKELNSIVEIIEGFKTCKYDSFIANNMLEILNKNYSEDVEMNGIIDTCKSKLFNILDVLNSNATFCHGDCTLSNIIKSNGEYYFFDQRFDRQASSYLLDFAKLKMSIDGYEERFGLTKFSIPYQIKESYNIYLKTHNIHDYVTILELMYICRLYRYKSKEEKYLVKKFAKEVIKQNAKLFERPKEG